ncbi:hypothetical protein PoB_005145000 [Plakobranchus ocellatus]|uniref:Uncharacterized protein n=1 Tax=Plakobranchus ocellatus TaxID=259542 RepID=A0AAV4C0Q1_9GAST|nr:hypothetical protein PoB_005145000 [Plakobranchus ocellatus]
MSNGTPSTPCPNKNCGEEVKLEEPQKEEYVRPPCQSYRPPCPMKVIKPREPLPAPVLEEYIRPPCVVYTAPCESKPPPPPKLEPEPEAPDCPCMPGFKPPCTNK